MQENPLFSYYAFHDFSLKKEREREEKEERRKMMTFYLDKVKIAWWGSMKKERRSSSPKVKFSRLRKGRRRRHNFCLDTHLMTLVSHYRFKARRGQWRHRLAGQCHAWWRHRQFRQTLPIRIPKASRYQSRTLGSPGSGQNSHCTGMYYVWSPNEPCKMPSYSTPTFFYLQLIIKATNDP